MKLVIKDESAAGQVLNEITLKFNSEYITVKELIEARIKEEVKRFLSNHKDQKRALVMPSPLEQRLNTNKKSTRTIDIEKQCYTAFEAFQNNGFFILIDDEQVEELEEKFLIDDSTKVSFIKLTPLVGG